jgi:hypothetical protein
MIYKAVPQLEIIMSENLFMNYSKELAVEVEKFAKRCPVEAIPTLFLKPANPHPPFSPSHILKVLLRYSPNVRPLVRKGLKENAG